MSIQDNSRHAAAAHDRQSAPVPPSGDEGGVDDLIRSLRSRGAGGTTGGTPRTGVASLGRYLRAYKGQLVVAAAVVLVIVVAVSAWPTVGGTADTLTTRLITSVMSLVPYYPPTVREAEPAPTEAAAPKSRPRSEAGASSAPAAASPRPPAAVPNAASAAASSTAATETPSPAPLARDTEGGAEFVYTSADLDVQPPKLLSQGPGQPGRVMNERTRLIELLVKPDGTVEQVMLRSPEGRLQDPILLSRAKMWQFEPARRGGRAVPYRVVMMWETPR